MPGYIHPPCGKTVPGGASGGHCAKCCLSFRGGAAFDRHMLRAEDGSYIHQDPASAVTATGKPLDYWLDGKGLWHLGPRDDRRWSTDEGSEDEDEDEDEEEAA